MSFRVIRSAETRWQGTLPEGSGRITLGSGAFDGPYSLRARVEEGERAANPEELPGMDHAAFGEFALQAKDRTIARALTGTDITLDTGVTGD